MRLPMSQREFMILAAWFDLQDARHRAQRPGDEVQRDLRRMAGTAEVLEGMPGIVCLIGSTRFYAAFAEWNLALTLAGKIVLSVGCDTKADNDLLASSTPEVRAKIKYSLDVLHMWKLILCDEVLCLNIGGYIGESTRREIGFAQMLGRPITYLEAMQSVPVSFAVPQEMQRPLLLATMDQVEGPYSFVKKDGGYDAGALDGGSGGSDPAAGKGDGEGAAGLDPLRGRGPR